LATALTTALTTSLTPTLTTSLSTALAILHSLTQRVEFFTGNKTIAIKVVRIKSCLKWTHSLTFRNLPVAVLIHTRDHVTPATATAFALTTTATSPAIACHTAKSISLKKDGVGLLDRLAPTLLF